ncbi:MAG: hypothetical protein HYS78_02010 [Parcubacteria group bacterium]|nr:hypothetical protein [Parcubacteria group bacterium]
MEKRRTFKKEQVIELADKIDMELAQFFASRIDKPCEAEVAPGDVINIRYLYIEKAKLVLFTFTNGNARAFLEAKIREYEGD